MSVDPTQVKCLWSETASGEEQLPLRVVPDSDEQVRRADGACRLIDRHLHFEALSSSPGGSHRLPAPASLS